MQTQLTKTYVTYQAQTRLLELGAEVAAARNWNKPDIKAKIDLGIKIRLFLKALQYSTYLTKPVIDRLVYTLADLCDANAIPYFPVVTTVDPPSILVGIPGDQGDQGEQGDEGGGVPFSTSNITSDTVVDSFAITESRGVEYTLNIYDDAEEAMRIMRIQGGWSSDGADFDDDGGIGQTIRGDMSGITMSIDVQGSTVRLLATVTSGNWTVEGTRKYVPNNGNGIVNPTSLTEGYIWVGNSDDDPQERLVSGDITISSTGTAAIATGVIVNADVSNSAALALSKLAALTASRAVVSDGSGVLTVSATTATQIGYLANVTSDVQAQLDTKLSSANGAISTVVSSNLTFDRLLISNPSGKIAVSDVTYLSGNDFYSSSNTGLSWRGGLVNTSGNGGDMVLRGGGSSFNTGRAGDLYLFGGIASGAGNTGAGNVYIRLLSGAGSGANGKLNIDTLPTSASGLSTGDVWNDSGTLKIVV